MMDSGNSGSMQSSSSAEEDYDSRPESISTIMGRPISNPPPPFHHPHHRHNQQQQQLQFQSTSSTMFDPLSNFFDPASLSSRSQVNNNPLLSLDMVWAQSNPRPDVELINPTDLSALIPSSSTQNQIQTRGQLPFLPASLDSQARAPPQLVHENNNNSSNNGSDMGPGVRGPGPIRNPRKRPRASRAPTTVLTTDTTNFRAMVQEFTGIPAPPFSSSTSALFSGGTRTRLELFSSRSDGHSLLDPSPPPPPYILRPFPQKAPFIAPPPPPPPSTSTSSVGPDVNNNSFLNMQNSILNLQPPLLNVQPPSNGTPIPPASENGPSGGVWAGPAWAAASWE